ncbi:hypothetical protein BU24DRAFT_470548 [Aaosphaeria arxii CBS 175.79]|uniref:Uncharacterized protein n=1 Tax=Aaosphaeria arxii CBS 175.79 TaxID=1450172 RepID=A0A6A5Y842_9PLEO|nr:uncharacterized protein BU24DRAFT_470548 [Aaosphaeria arxii CBS 175.79]KAF2021752.1 hypothetical protein BU24DRAFT_470548 [Aaosphaeria arxii CBS 175.79]
MTGPSGAQFIAGQFAGPDAGVTLTSSGPPELSNLLPFATPLDETHDRNERTYTTSLQQRQQQAAEFYRSQHNHSRVSSSSGSQTTLRRTPNFEDLSRARSASIEPPAPDPPPQPRGVRFAPTPAEQLRSPPHPALRISRRTASAIHWVLEEAIRVPVPFTPVLEEENAQMSDLTGGGNGNGNGNGRAANGSARTTAGPVPVSQSDRSNIRTPQMIMNQRREREAARRRETEADAARVAEEQRKAEEERRRSAERRAQAISVAGAPAPTDNAGAPRRAAQSAPLQPGESQYSQYPPTSGPGVPRQPERQVPPQSGGPVNPPTSSQHPDTTSGAQYGRPRARSQTQQQSQSAPGFQNNPGASDSRRPPPTQHARRPSAQAGSSQAGPSTVPPAPGLPPAGSLAGSQQRGSTTSTFPHAFERWENLSSHWEGLTSYWIRKLEQNAEEVRRDALSQQMSRQITDLSAAGANLFHAVVELQRLRASSERKFQRWFYEHRQDQERAQEREAQLDHTIRVEREARANAVTDMERMATEKKNAERMVAEMKRELQISKEEARRAWEELGRREQEERDRTFSLREGQPTLVGGVQVVPMAAQGIGRQDSVSQRQQGGDDSFAVGQLIEGQYSYEEGHSPTDTDPFTEGARRGTPQRFEPEHSSLAQGAYVPSGASASTRPGATSQPTEQAQAPAPSHPEHPTSTAGQQAPIVSTSRPEAFYQQPEAYLHRESVASVPEDVRSYVTSQPSEISDPDEEYAYDHNGNYILDESGHRIPFRDLRERDSDEYDVQEDRRRELEHLQRYGTAPQGTSSYATTSSAGPSHPQSYPTANAPDYSGEGYGEEWEGMRHHHPTRLSDVLEEDERSRTSPSRASQASRGIF